jgi:gluconolactonase
MLALSPLAIRVGDETWRIDLVVETDAHEGPVHVASEDALYFTTSRPQVAIRRLALATGRVSTIRAHTDAANGMTLGLDERLIVCEQGSPNRAAAITAVDRATGAVETIVDRWHGLPLNSPNDVVVAGDGAIWFTDPSYGYRQGFRPLPTLRDRVYRFDRRTEELRVVADGLDKPNGLAFSPDGSTLYVGDNGTPHRLLAYDVLDGRRLAGRRVVDVFPSGHPDGIKVDGDGRIFASTPTGVRILDADGRRLGELPVPGAVNFTFAGDTLLITADTAIWAAAPGVTAAG